MKKLILLLSLISIIACNQPTETTTESSDTSYEIYDCHVHLMSPSMITYWKSLGIPFSKPEVYYSNVDSILARNKATRIDLIGMAYIYENEDFYQGDDRRKQVQKENDYLLETAKKYPNTVTPYFAVNPLTDYALEEIDRCLAATPNSGLKLHFNTSQVYLTEPAHLNKVKPIFNKAAENKLPVLLHFDNWHPKFGEPDIQLLIDSILKEISPLTLTIAHFGTSGGFNDKTKRFIDAFVTQFEKGNVPKKHTIRFDISAVALDKDSEGVSKLTDGEFEKLNTYIHKLGIDRVIFGTDYPLYSSVEYVDVLKNRVGLTEEEINKIIKK